MNACLRFGSLLMALAILAGCAGLGPAVSGTSPGAATAVTTLEGQVYFPMYQVQSTIADVATAATVSLIDPVLNQTCATTVTDSAGRFSLSFSGVTLATHSYYLEAVKGLGSNAVGHDAARVRTILLWGTHGWTSLTSSLSNGRVTIDTSTTALSLICSLRSTTSDPATPSLLIGTLDVRGGGLDDRYAGTGTGVPDADVTLVRSLVAASLVADADPLDFVIYANGSFATKASPTISYISPPLASVGSQVIIVGTNFSPSLAGNAVTFSSGLLGTVATCSATTITVTVPLGTVTGTISVQVLGALTATSSFSVLPPVGGGLNP